MEALEKIDYNVVAKHIMELIQLDNGYGHVEGISFPAKWVNKISAKCEIFFENNPDKFNDEFIDEYGVGGDEGEKEIFMGLVGFKELDELLDKYFDDGMGTGKVEIKPRIMHTYRPIKGKEYKPIKIK